MNGRLGIPRPGSRVRIGVALLVCACGTRDGDGDGWTVREGDCDDDNVGVQPLSPEFCGNGIDDDCDGLVDGDDPETERGVEAWEDADGDGYAGTYAGLVCDKPAFTESTDCDDEDPDVSPAATEVCDDGLDNNCDGTSRECEGIGAAEGTDGADAAWFILSPFGRTSDVLVAAPCGDLDGDGDLDVAMLMALSDWYYYGEYYSYAGTNAPLRSWLTLGVFDANARGTRTEADAWARPIDSRESVDLGLFGDALLCAGDMSGDGRSELVLQTEGVGGLGSGIHVLAAPDRGDLTPDVRATWTFTYDRRLFASADRAGDVDGDGAADLLVRMPYASYYADDDRAAFLFPGAAEGEHTEADALAAFHSSAEIEAVGACAGQDADGDGVSDLAIGVARRAYVFSGAVQGDLQLTDADAMVVGDGGGDFGAALAWIADPESGVARLAVYDGVARTRRPRSLGLYGISGDTLVLAASVVGDDDREPGGAISVGDLDGDGTDEIGVSVEDGFVFIAPPREGSVDLADARMGLLAEWIGPAGVGDVDGDGDGDLVATVYDSSGEGFAGLWLGGPPQ